MARVTNAFLVRWAQGWMEVADAASVTAHGRHEAFLSLGHANTSDEATRVASAILARLAWPSERTAVAIEPTGTDDVPYVHVVTGDTVMVPDWTGTPAPMRWMGVTVTEDDEGNPYFVPELEP
jgi:hypothetical protein